MSLVSLAAGQADIAGTSWLQLLDAEAHGNDFVIIASMVPVTPEGLISLPRRAGAEAWRSSRYALSGAGTK